MQIIQNVRIIYYMLSMEMAYLDTLNHIYTDHLHDKCEWLHLS